MTTVCECCEEPAVIVHAGRCQECHDMVEWAEGRGPRPDGWQTVVRAMPEENGT